METDTTLGGKSTLDQFKESLAQLPGSDFINQTRGALEKRLKTLLDDDTFRIWVEETRLLATEIKLEFKQAIKKCSERFDKLQLPGDIRPKSIFLDRFEGVELFADFYDNENKEWEEGCLVMRHESHPVCYHTPDGPKIRRVIKAHLGAYKGFILDEYYNYFLSEDTSKDGWTKDTFSIRLGRLLIYCRESIYDALEFLEAIQSDHYKQVTRDFLQDIRQRIPEFKEKVWQKLKEILKEEACLRKQKLHYISDIRKEITSIQESSHEIGSLLLQLNPPIPSNEKQLIIDLGTLRFNGLDSTLGSLFPVIHEISGRIRDLRPTFVDIPGLPSCPSLRPRRYDVEPVIHWDGSKVKIALPSKEDVRIYCGMAKTPEVDLKEVDDLLEVLENIRQSIPKVSFHGIARRDDPLIGSISSSDPKHRDGPLLNPHKNYEIYALYRNLLDKISSELQDFVMSFKRFCAEARDYQKRIEENITWLKPRVDEIQQIIKEQE